MNMSMNPAFEVKIDPGYNPEDTPMTGEQYLQKVIYERERCPDVVTVPLDSSKLKMQVPCVTIAVEKPVCPRHLRPTKEWQAYQIMCFSKLRQKIQNLLDEATDIESAGHLSKLLEDSGETLVGAENLFTSVQPLLNVVLVINQNLWWKLINHQIAILKTITKKSTGETEDADSECLIKIVHRNDIKDWLGSWIYAGLLCVKTPLEPEMHDELRKLAGALANIRNFYERCTFNDVTHLAIPICIIAKYFQQYDLAD